MYIRGYHLHRIACMSARLRVAEHAARALHYTAALRRSCPALHWSALVRLRYPHISTMRPSAATARDAESSSAGLLGGITRAGAAAVSATSSLLAASAAADDCCAVALPRWAKSWPWRLTSSATNALCHAIRHAHVANGQRGCIQTNDGRVVTDSWRWSIMEALHDCGGP